MEDGLADLSCTLLHKCICNLPAVVFGLHDAVRSPTSISRKPQNLLENCCICTEVKLCTDIKYVEIGGCNVIKGEQGF